MTLFERVHMPSFAGATEWLNSEPLGPAALRGHVVLVNFWTPTCINWLRQESYVRTWSQAYRNDGLVVIGVHTPEFSFEHDIDRVRQATKERAIDYPIALDNDYEIWDAFANHYWPALYFVDADGIIRGNASAGLTAPWADAPPTRPTTPDHHLGIGRRHCHRPVLILSCRTEDSNPYPTRTRSRRVPRCSGTLRSEVTELNRPQRFLTDTPGTTRDTLVADSGSDLATAQLTMTCAGGMSVRRLTPMQCRVSTGAVASRWHRRA